MTKPPLEPMRTVKSRYFQPERPPADDAEHVFAGNAVNRIGRALFGAAWVDNEQGDRWRKSIEHIAGAARDGAVNAFAMYAGFTPIESSRWAREDLMLVFVSGKIDPFPSGSGSRRWLFFDKRSVLALLYRLGAKDGTSAPFEFDMQAHRWRLFDAAVWVATGGQATTTQAVAAGLEDVGCKLLFAKLASLGYGAPPISGFTVIGEQRSPVPHAYLERTHTGWLGAGSGHLVRFYPERDPEDEQGPGVVMADFKMKGHTEPYLFDLSIEREALLALYPRIEVQKGSGGKRGPLPRDNGALLAKMKELLDGPEPPKSVWAAAGIVAQANPERNVQKSSTQRRIADAFNEEYEGYKTTYYPG